jgi:hypothetical protein
MHMHLTKRLLGTLVVAFMLTGMFAAFGIADPGPNGNNDKGLCTAYFNGQKKGHDKHGSPGPFAELERIAEEGYDGDGDTADAVYWWCSIRDGAPGIGGNPDNSGRWTCSDEAGEEDGDYCERNESPGNGNGNGA